MNTRKSARSSPFAYPGFRLPLSKTALVAFAMACLVSPVSSASRQSAPLPPQRPRGAKPPPIVAQPTSPTPPQASPTQPAADAPAPAARQDVDTCLSKLNDEGIKSSVAMPPAPAMAACGISAPVQLISIALSGGAVVDLPDHPMVECEFARVFSDYVRTAVAPLATGTLGSGVATIRTGPGYDCRGRDHFAGGKVSAHGKGIAVDLTEMVFADKRRVSVDHQTGAQETAFFHGVRAAACGWFTTVLGPGSDAFHTNNIHIDVEKHGSSGGYRICQ